MARPASGQVVVRKGKGTSFALRFRAYGQRQYLTLGLDSEGWTRARAEEELQNVLADVRRGLWRPPEPPSPVETPTTIQTFHEFASEWFEQKKPEIRPATIAAYEQELSIHLLPFFAKHRLDQITVQEVDRYRQHKVREGRIGARMINKTLTRLAQILEVAVEYELIARNPATGRRRRLKVGRPRPVHLDSAGQIAALLDAATELDARETARTDGRRAVVATLAFAGLRAGELADLRWRDVDLAAGRIYVGRSKTDAGMREVDLLPILRDELLQHRIAAGSPDPDQRVFTTSRGGTRDRNNIGLRVMRPVVGRANELLRERGENPLPEGVTAHKLRHTFASILIALGRDPAYVMAQLGHADPGFTLRVYTHAMRSGDGEREALKALIEGRDWAQMGTNRDLAALDAQSEEAPRRSETASMQRKRSMPPGGFEPPTPGLGNLCSIP